MSSGLRPLHWQSRALDCADLAERFGLRLERDEGRGEWLICREGTRAVLYPAQTIGDVEVWLNGHGWGFRGEPKTRQEVAA